MVILMSPDSKKLSELYEELFKSLTSIRIFTQRNLLKNKSLVKNKKKKKFVV